MCACESDYNVDENDEIERKGGMMKEMRDKVCESDYKVDENDEIERKGGEER
jgi:hypothetical protein